MFKKLHQSFWNYLQSRPTARLFIEWSKRRRIRLMIFTWIVAHVIGALTSVRAIMDVRTPQGTIAWVTALNTTPFISVPAYWIFGSALQLAALRFVEIKILVPDKTDNRLIQLSGWSFVEDLEKVGIQVYRYKKGFMHQKVMLVDDLYSAIGTANFDNCSFRLNFEITMGIADAEFAGRMKRMLENDFANAEQVHAAEFQKKGFWDQFAMRGARLMAPIQ